MQHGRSVIAFLEDPDGYKVELIQKGRSSIESATRGGDIAAAVVPLSRWRRMRRGRPLFLAPCAR